MVPLTRVPRPRAAARATCSSITDAGARPRVDARRSSALALLKNFDADRRPPGYGFAELVKQFTQPDRRARQAASASSESDADEFEWRVLFVAGMWFQDLFNYDFRRTEMCIIPYGTQLGEISFCAYNTGVGWRQIIEKMKQTATVAEWFKTHGRHPVYAKNQHLPLPGRAAQRRPARNRPAPPAAGSRLREGRGAPRRFKRHAATRSQRRPLGRARARDLSGCWPRPAAKSRRGKALSRWPAPKGWRISIFSLCRQRIAEISTEPALPGAPAFEAQRVAILGRARGEPLLWAREPGSDRRRSSHPGTSPWRGLRALIRRFERDPAELRAQVLREGYVYASDPQTRSPWSLWSSCRSCSTHPRFSWSAAARRHRLVRSGGKHPVYRHAGGPLDGARGELLLGDRVATTESDLGAPVHRDLAAWSREYGAEHVLVQRITPGHLLARAHFGATAAGCC